MYCVGAGVRRAERHTSGHIFGVRREEARTSRMCDVLRAERRLLCGLLQVVVVVKHTIVGCHLAGRIQPTMVRQHYAAWARDTFDRS